MLYYIPSFRRLIQDIDMKALCCDEQGCSSMERMQYVLQSSTLALQKVFYLLGHSRVSVDLTSLFTSFGWNIAEMNQQVSWMKT